MTKQELKPGAFLYYPEITKGVETHDTLGTKYVSIRSKSIDDMIIVGKAIIITVKDVEGMMVLHPETANNLYFEKSKDKYGTDKDYYLLKYEWLPTDEFSLTVFNGAYGAIYNMRQLIKKQYNGPRD
jgi:hypothetical protein